MSQIPYSDANLDQLLTENLNLAKQPHFWKNRVGEHLTAATKQWPHLYNFNQAEDHRNFTFNKLAIHCHGLRKVYLLTLYAFDILVPENIDIFGEEVALSWFLQRQLPIPEKLLDFDSEFKYYHMVMMLERGYPINYIIDYLQGQSIDRELPIFMVLKYGQGEWFSKYFDQKIERMAKLDHDCPFARASLEPEIKALVQPRIKHHMLEDVLSRVREINRIIEESKKHTNGQPFDVKPQTEIPIPYLDYYIFPFVSTFDKEQRTYFQLLRGLKGTAIASENVQKVEKLPLINCDSHIDIPGDLELALYLVEQDDPEMLEHALKCVRSENKDNEKWERNGLRALCLSYCQSNSELFNHLIKLDLKDQNIMGPINFQTAYHSFTKMGLTRFSNRDYGQFVEVMQALCPTYLPPADSSDEDESHTSCDSDHSK